ncbi:MAG: thioredoxin domain-containing protein [Geitlerinemataceae cyanobacterium]
MKHRSPILAVGITVVFAIATLFLTRPSTGASSAMSPVSGLMSLKAMARESVPYAVAIADEKPTLLEFYADWCTSCQALAPSLQKLHDEYGDRVDFVALDIDDPQWREQVATFKATGVPQLTFLDRSGSAIDTIVGKVPASILDRAIQRLLQPT